MAESEALSLPDEAATGRLGNALALGIRGSRPGQLVVFLAGDLGVGKTALTRALLGSLGHATRVPSPTYTLVEPYTVPGYRVLHVDLYRLSDPGELDYLGLAEQLGPGSLLIVEWPDRGAGRLPAPDLTVVLAVEGAGRRAEFHAATAVGGEVVGQAVQLFRSS
jgi:tRNA threonylcarbamoyladenosine biosynthesis protein TsaE